MRIKNYNNFINENMALAKSIISRKMEAFEKLKELLSKNIGFIGKFTDYLMYENIAYEDLKNLYNDMLNLKSKNVNINISNMRYEELVDKIQSSMDTISINSLINKFPSLQKDLAKKLLSSLSGDDIKNMILKISKKDDIEAFISKISRYKTESDLKNTLKIFSKDTLNDRSVIKDLIAKMDKSKIVNETEDSIIVYTATLEDATVLASDTSWCIIHSGMWNNYTKGKYQFILFDFSKDEYKPEFKIGFTITPAGLITAAHDILDNGVSNKMQDILKEKGVTTYTLVSGLIENISGLNIDSINVKTTQIRVNSLISTTTDKEDLIKLLKKIFDMYKVDKDFLLSDYSLTDNKLRIVKEIITKTFSSYNILTDDDFNKVDKRILEFTKRRGMPSILSKIHLKNEYNESLNDDVFIKGLDYWKDNVFIRGDFYEYSFINNKDDYRNIVDGDYKKPKKVIIKLSDRLNSIYKNYEFKNIDDKKNIGNMVVFLNAILLRKEKSGNIEIPKDYYMDYPGLLSDTIDPTGSGIHFNKRNFNVTIIEKKNYYSDTNFSFRGNFEYRLYELIDHLKGFEFTVNLNRSNLSNMKSLTRLGGQFKTDILNLTKNLDTSELPKEFKIDKVTIIINK